VLVNAAESEPASRKDRRLARLRPHLVIEGALARGAGGRADACILYTHDREQPPGRSMRRVTS